MKYPDFWHTDNGRACLAEIKREYSLGPDLLELFGPDYFIDVIARNDGMLEFLKAFIVPLDELPLLINCTDNWGRLVIDARLKYNI